MGGGLSSERSRWLQPGEHVAGDRWAPIVLVEYGDYACPASALAHEVVAALRRSLRDRLCYAFRHFPSAAHPHALLAAEAAEAAGAQGRFWRMHELLFENHESLDPHALVSLGVLAGVEVRRLVADLRAHRFRERVRDEVRGGRALGVVGTPTFFVGGERYDGGWDFDSLWRAVSVARA